MFYRDYGVGTYRWYMKIAICLILLVGMAGAAPSLSKGATSDWKLVSVNGRDYLSLPNVAKFYQLQATQNPGDLRWTLSDGRPRLETCANPRELYINGVKHWLAFPTLVQNGETLITRLDLAKTIEPCLRPTMIANLAPFHTVVLDAGHGGEDNGSHSVSGQEKTYTLDVIENLRKSLQAKGFNVVLTRDGDVYLPLESRADFANHSSDSVFVSVHFNSSADASAKGVEVYAMTPCGAASTSDAGTVPDQFTPMPGNDFDNASLALATCVHHSILGHISDNDRGVKRARFAVLRLTHAPAILVEGGFLSNGAESREINDPAWREKLAESIAVGVRSFQNVAGYKEPPKLMADYRNEAVLPGPAVFVNPATLASNVAVPKVQVLPVSNPRP